jgi:uncharacterized damage-inducible protein DinB
MYTGLKELLLDWREESARTRKIFEALTDESLSFMSHPGGRTIGFLAWHITTAITDMFGRLGLRITGPEPDSPVPANASEIRAAYADVSAGLVTRLEESWTDDSLGEENDMFGAVWSNAQTINVLIRHQIHHRAQMTVLLRQAGVVIPGIYGPAKEEWAAMGREAQP